MWALFFLYCAAAIESAGLFCSLLWWRCSPPSPFCAPVRVGVLLRAPCVGASHNPRRKILSAVQNWRAVRAGAGGVVRVTFAACTLAVLFVSLCCLFVGMLSLADVQTTRTKNKRADVRTVQFENIFFYIRKETPFLIYPFNVVTTPFFNPSLFYFFWTFILVFPIFHSNFFGTNKFQTKIFNFFISQFAKFLILKFQILVFVYYINYKLKKVRAAKKFFKVAHDSHEIFSPLWKSIRDAPAILYI